MGDNFINFLRAAKNYDLFNYFITVVFSGGFNSVKAVSGFKI